MGFFFLAVAVITAILAISAETQHLWGPWVNRLTSSRNR